MGGERPQVLGEAESIHSVTGHIPPGQAIPVGDDGAKRREYPCGQRQAAEGGDRRNQANRSAGARVSFIRHVTVSAPPQPAPGKTARNSQGIIVPRRSTVPRTKRSPPCRVPCSPPTSPSRFSRSPRPLETLHPWSPHGAPPDARPETPGGIPCHPPRWRLELRRSAEGATGSLARIHSPRQREPVPVRGDEPPSAGTSPRRRGQAPAGGDEQAR